MVLECTVEHLGSMVLMWKQVRPLLLLLLPLLLIFPLLILLLSSSLLHTFPPLSLHPSSPKFYFHFFSTFSEENRLDCFCFHFLLLASPILFSLSPH